MIYEIRNYHYEPTLIGKYKEWAAKQALPYIRKHLDVLGFWVNTPDRPEVSGKPLDELGTATVTWIIRWDDLAKRNEVMGKVFASPEWREIMKGNPGQENYHRIEAKFADSL
jgi:hypothetical protein